ncbi:MEDS domain-containing protein [Cellulomonas aerilata]|uniref:STAS domain-containing protein n=1 Tax=Cellulomonas aerilata TaxID=515326 RepID=A0A512D9W8_9CELL|nr:MEDS domain-containing protein [Cellulomonas aerilata]GEO33273.1 hypothetical protein CAE01nite_09980 [Cellulomonas aerilata]
MSSRFQVPAVAVPPQTHVCWAFRGAREFAHVAERYTREGLDRHERVLVLDGQDTARGLVATMRAAGRTVLPTQVRGEPVLVTLSWAPDLRAGGASADGASAGGPSADGASADARRSPRHLAAEAVADGFAGLRIVTDATEVVRSRERRERFVAAEHVMDAATVTAPVTILCGFDVDELGPATVAEVACVHSFTTEPLSPFLFRALPQERTVARERTVALAGEVDSASAGDLYRAVLRVVTDTGGTIRIDVSEAHFMSHAALLALDRAARALDCTVRLDAASPVTRWMVRFLELDRVVAAGTP